MTLIGRAQVDDFTADAVVSQILLLDSINPDEVRVRSMRAPCLRPAPIAVA